MTFDIDRKDLVRAYEKACDLTADLWKSGREVLEDYGLVAKRRRAWPWISGALAAGAVGAWFWMRRREEQSA
jgi:hypothetical protein